MTESERKRVINDLYSVKVSTSLLYVTPEQASTDFFKVSHIFIIYNTICENLSVVINIIIDLRHLFYY
jgi:hypothetical protein